MNPLLRALGDLLAWMERVTPIGPLVALALLLAVAWLTRRWIAWDRARPSTGLPLVRLWTWMLALSCLLLLAAWVVSRQTTVDASSLVWKLSGILLVAALAPLAHGLRTTLLWLTDRPGRGGGPMAWVRSAAWALFAAVMLVCAHNLAMGLVFPYAGGVYHAMFAYTHEGRVEVALSAWRASVLILGAAAVVFSVWIPLPWWVLYLLATAVGLVHWRGVYAWRSSPVSPHFHHTLTVLFVALPFAVLLISAAGALLRRAWGRRRTRRLPPAALAAE